MNTISKITTVHAQAPSSSKTNEPSSPSVQPTTKSHPHNSSVPPALTTTALAVPGNADNANLGLSEQQMKRQGLESLVAVLRSLVSWGTTAGKNVADAAAVDSVAPNSASSSRLPGMASDPSLDKLSAPSGQDPSRVSTPEISDDPGKFENAKQRKTVLQDGIRKFNSKPSKVVASLLHTCNLFNHRHRASNFFCKKVLLSVRRHRT